MRGSKPGERRGGRQKGTPNKVIGDLRANVVAKYGTTPLEYFYAIMTDKAVPYERRDWAAAQAAPYVTPKLANTVITGDPDKPLEHKVSVEFVGSKSE